MFICGSGSFGHQDEDETYLINNIPKRSKRSTSFCKLIGKDNGNKNPYADRGLDKFYALLQELDDKKQKIYTQKGSEDISFIRFVYTNDDKNVKPIVVRVKEKSKQENNTPTNLPKPLANTNNSTLAAEKNSNTDANTRQGIEADEQKEVSGNKNCKMLKKSLTRCKGSLKLQNLSQPYYYFPMIMILILLFLAIYGRSFAILCTSIGWYLIPTINGGITSSASSSSSSSNTRRPKRKHSQKDFVKKLSEKKVVHSDIQGPSSPRSVLTGLADNIAQQGHRRSL